MPEVSVQQSLEEALNQRLKALVFNDLPPEVLKAYLAEKVKEEIRRLVEKYEFRRDLSEAISRALHAEIADIIAEVMEMDETQTALRSAVEVGFQAGVQDVAARMRQKASRLVD